MPKLPKLPVNPVDIPCPRCGVKAGAPCIKLAQEVELVHLERIEAALAMNKHLRKGFPTA